MSHDGETFEPAARVDLPARRSARFTLEPLADIEPRETGYLVKDMLPRRGVAFFAGPSTSAKTFLATELTLRVCRGEPFCGRRTRQVGAIYVAAEDADGVRRRVKAWRMRYGAHGAFQMIPEPPNLREPDVEAELIGVISDAALELDAEGTPLGLIVFDTLSKVAPGADQNASGDMSLVMATFARIAERFNALVLVIAHTPKDETRGIAGWYGQFGAAEAVVMLTRDAEDDRLRIATVTKQKNGQDGGRIAFRLEELEIGEDEDGDPITSCVVAFEDAPDTPARRKAAPKLNQFATVFLKALMYLHDNGQTVQAPPLEGVPSLARAVRLCDVREWAFKTGLADADTKPGTARMRWDRAKADLVAAEKIRLHDELVWPTP